ncbi:MAG: hypothetical protein JW788_04390 [Candidatus Omnitrophica bacterium]|nr:hypothetical protein [Candidatus Omnitrophota bacterium]
MQKVLSAREKMILMFTAAALALSLIFNSVLMPAFKKHDSLNKEIALVNARLNKYARLLAQKDSLKHQEDKLSAEGLSFLEKPTIVKTLALLENMAKKSAIHILDIRPQAPRSSGSYQEISVDLKAEATLEDYLKFIYDLENSPLLLKIKKLQLTAKPNKQLLDSSFSISQASF